MPSRRPRIVRAAIAVIERGGRYLISRRRAGDHLGGYWEFPGGKRRAGESWEQCIRREVREELGVTIRPLRRLSPLRFRYPDRTVRLEVFRCELVDGTPQPLGCAAVRWAGASQLRRLRFPPADRPLTRWLSRAIMKAE
jgi:mutator protein MutT